MKDFFWSILHFSWKKPISPRQSSQDEKIYSIDDRYLCKSFRFVHMNGEMDEEFLSEIIFISLQNFAFLLVISLRKKSICRQRRISLRLFNFLLIEENYIHFSSELSSSKNFSFTLLGLTISAQLGTISLFSREMVQPSSLTDRLFRSSSIQEKIH